MSNMKLRRALALCLLALPAALLLGCAEDDPLASFRADGYPLPSQISPNIGVAGTAVTIDGELFGAVKGEGCVKIYCGPSGTAILADIISWSDTQIRFHMPAPATAGQYNTQLLVELYNDAGLKCPWEFYVTVLTTTTAE